MSVMPGVEYLNAVTSSNMSRYDVVCIHTIVGYAPAHAAHFSTRADGHIFQSRNTRYRSAANLNGNHRVIAIENEDYGSAFGSWGGSNVPGFTDAQIESIARICAWAYEAHGIPLVLAPDSKPTSRGIAYHRQGIDGNFGPFRYGGRVDGGELWSSAFGKVCPGDNRITQLIERIIPRARQIAGLDAPTKKIRYPEEFMYIRCENDIAILSGHVFIGLGSPGEKADAEKAIAERQAPYQWVERYTWQALDERSKALSNFNAVGLPVRVVGEVAVDVTNESVNVVDVTPTA